MEVEIVSKDCIKPSSPTPPHLKTYNISLLDQIVPPCYYSMILYYLNQETQIYERSLLLKQSLSETLSRFYPLAGKMKDNLSIDCNDEGVYYIEARANISMSDYLNLQDLSSLEKLFPKAIPSPESYLAMIQETTFACGGFTIGILVSHIVCDGTALSSFLKEWASTACKSNEEIKQQREKYKEILHPYLDSSSIFLQKEEATAIALSHPIPKRTKNNRGRFLFNASAITNLKEKSISSCVKNPTRVEVVTALLTKCLVPIFNSKSGHNKPIAITHAVNVRRRAVPPIPECSIGNFLLPTAALCETEETELSSIVWKLREAIEKINCDFVKKLQGDEGYLRLFEIFKELNGVLSGAECVYFSSWCNFGLYEVDFGWGKPVWTTTGGGGSSEMFFSNVIVLMNAREEKGVEAWVGFDEQDMVLLEKDEELLKYVCIDPVPV